MHIVGIVAARMASTRYPNKPMVPILGMPMIGHVYHRSRLATSLDDLWVATCDRELVDYVESIGGKAVMTSDHHERATERIAEAVPIIEAQTKVRIDAAALLQGDEPMILPSMIDELVAPMRHSVTGASVVNLMSAIETNEEFADPNTVKVVLDSRGNALYFSREPIPSTKKFTGPIPRWKQLGMIIFSRQALMDYVGLTPTPLEQIESVDMNRLLEHGRSIRMIPTKHRTAAVDRPADRDAVESLMRDDALLPTYLRA
jgi:3-deoxy-manno-octulosonate cytidylyltransferase (CMP-KDO synthetase)